MSGHTHRNAAPAPATTFDLDAPTVPLFKAGRHRLGDRPRTEKTVGNSSRPDQRPQAGLPCS